MPPAKKPAGKKIERQDRLAWWCPICDNANTQSTSTCGGCAAERDGDNVKAPS
jgi:uncharacterized protein (UPF0305 family)